NVGYVIVVQEDGLGGLSEVGQVATIFDRPARVMRVSDPLPPAWVVGGSRPADSPTAALLAMAEPGFDPAAEVVLGDGGRVPPPAGGGLVGGRAHRHRPGRPGRAARQAGTVTRTRGSRTSTSVPRAGALRIVMSPRCSRTMR